ncbi:hypothetical protein Q664_17110 [Archangium violaceum Cb vi76]|uniref:Uncharacterized protein n=1 Tax=Archangium violaceum Cb vi76 TaxID=1406225 RepID=A0A084SUA9_9BACT|nr:hypothetical protein Q664_17110 [Archangium violaceum Cb vi76]
MSQARLPSPHALALAVRLHFQFMASSTLRGAASVALVLASLMGAGEVWASEPHRLGMDMNPRLQMQELALVI